MAGVLFLLVLSTVVVSGMALVRQTTAAQQDGVDWQGSAATAWRGLNQRYQPTTGLFDAVPGFSFSTVWEIGSAIAATHSARQLGLIPSSEYDNRLRLLLRTLESMPLVEGIGFNRFYAAADAAPVNEQFEKNRLSGWSAIHHGRLLLWLDRVAEDAQHRDAVMRVVRRLALPQMTANGYLQSANLKDGRIERYQDGRIGYEQYAAQGFRAWNVRAERALDIDANALPVAIDGFTLPADRRGDDRLTSEPFVLYGLELGWTPRLAQVAQAVHALQQNRYRTTGQLTAASADAIDRAPDYYYTFCVYCSGKSFISVGPSGEPVDFGWISTEAVYGWQALLPSAYTRSLIEAVQPARDSARGWSSGVYERGGASTNVYDLNTAALVLEAAAYAIRHSPVVAGPPKPLARLESTATAHEQPLPVGGFLVSPLLNLIALIALAVVTTLVVLYTIRHYIFTLNRLFGRQRHPYVDVREADWPTVTVVIPAHNEEKVITHALDALLICDYPRERLDILVVNDRSTDATGARIEEVAAQNPGRLTAMHRTTGTPGKAAALKDALARVSSEIILIFDADYLPGRGLIKQLVAPFFDPEIGAVMGRVVPINVGTNLLTRLLDLERAGGYQVDQQARMNLGLVPQFGGTVGGLRRIALESVGGWREDSLTEDTDITYRLLLRGWGTAYQNRSECYEEVPESWPVRIRQIRRWSEGHNQCLRRYFNLLAQNLGWTHWLQRVDGAMLLGVYAMSAVLVLGWLLVIALFFAGSNPAAWLYAILAVAAYSSLGNFAVFFEIAAAARLDGYRNRIRLLPFLFFAFLVNVIATARTAVPRRIIFRGRPLVWHKTERSRTTLPSII